MFSFSLKSQGCEHFEREGVGGGDVTGETLRAEVAAAFACRTKRKLAASLSTTATGTTRRRSPFLDCLPTLWKVIIYIIKLRSFLKIEINFLFIRGQSTFHSESSSSLKWSAPSLEGAARPSDKLLSKQGYIFNQSFNGKLYFNVFKETNKVKCLFVSYPQFNG